ncbi:MAG: helix-turn-helix domain-containing protein [Chloroflexi bacterium]|nr:helix-turn-helix domain-containing protein [Chloroflexota bacterium]
MRTDKLLRAERSTRTGPVQKGPVRTVSGCGKAMFNSVQRRHVALAHPGPGRLIVYRMGPIIMPTSPQAARCPRLTTRCLLKWTILSRERGVGRRVTAAQIQSHVRERRLERGLAQSELARRAGLTRQSISAIEAGQYVPNTLVAIRLAQSLNCSVEDLFGLPSRPARASIELVAGQAPGTRRLALAQVADRWVGYPLSAGRELQLGFVGADALLGDVTSPDDLLCLTSPERVERTAVLLGCDPGLGILGARLGLRSPDVRVLWLSASSQAALGAVASGNAHVAGIHLPDPRSGTYNLLFGRQALARTGGLVVEFARWEQGFVVSPGNPKSITRVDDLVRTDVRMVNREPGSGSRAFLDALLTHGGLPTELIAGYQRTVTSHVAAAAAVAGGGGDVAVALRATALALGLEFVPLGEVRFDFIIPRAHVDHPAVAGLLELLNSGALRAELGALPGYDATRTGSVHLDLAAEHGS